MQYMHDTWQALWTFKHSEWSGPEGREVVGMRLSLVFVLLLKKMYCDRGRDRGRDRRKAVRRRRECAGQPCFTLFSCCC